MVLLSPCRICAARVDPAIARMGSLELKARLNSCWSARVRNWDNVEFVKMGLSGREALWIEATLSRSKTTPRSKFD